MLGIYLKKTTLHGNVVFTLDNIYFEDTLIKIVVYTEYRMDCSHQNYCAGLENDLRQAYGLDYSLVVEHLSMMHQLFGI